MRMFHKKERGEYHGTREEMNCGGDLCKEMLDVGDGQIAARKQ